MSLIADNARLGAFCDSLAESPYIAVDTEFMRESTYWPKLCLIQIAAPGEKAAVIDVLAAGLDLAPLFSLLAAPKVVKVFHAARQDLEIFYQLMKQDLPAPVFDTQVAAMVCGFGDQVGYDAIAFKLANVHIDKSSRFTDWSARPLSDRQIQYALADVTHLCTIYEELRQRLESNSRAAWLDEEMALLTAPKTYAMDPEQAFQRIKSKGLRPKTLAILREVAAWREREAQKRNLPRNRVLRDESLAEIAHHTPSSAGQLARTRGLGKHMAESSQGSAILKAVARGLALPDDQCPKFEKKPTVPRGLAPVIDLLGVLLKMRCEESGVARKLIASSADIELLAAFGEKADVRALNGWRREVYGQDALRLRSGKIALVADGKRLLAMDLPGSET